MEKSVQNCAESLVTNIEKSGSDVCNIKRYIFICISIYSYI